MNVSRATYSYPIHPNSLPELRGSCLSGETHHEQAVCWEKGVMWGYMSERLKTDKSGCER